jgi:hypothetical protein
MSDTGNCKKVDPRSTFSTGDPSCKKVVPPATFLDGLPATAGDRDGQYKEFRAVTDDLLFAKQFHSALEAVLKDDLNTNGERVMAWVIRTAWGHTSLYCVLPTGEPAYASDCARDLKINPGSVSRILAYKEQRGYLERRGIAKVIYPVIAPVLSPEEPEKVARDATYAAFFDDWKVANASTYEELLVAEATRNRIRKLVLAAWHLVKRPQRTADASLDKIPEDFKEASSSDLFVAPEATTTPFDPEPPAPAVALEAGIIRMFVGAGKDNPTPRQIAEAIAALPDDPEAHAAFLESLRPKMARVRHPGILMSLVSGFNVGWPAERERRKREKRDAEDRAAEQVRLEEEARAWIAAHSDEYDDRMPARREAGSERNEDDKAKGQGNG